MEMKETATVEIRKVVTMDRDEMDKVLMEHIAKKYDIDLDICDEITVFTDRTFGDPHIIFETSEAVTKK